jgi:excisionase family DNA binding protein
MRSHKLLSGETVPLRSIDAREAAFLTDLQKMAKTGVSFFDIERVAIGPGSPALRGRSRVTPEIVSSPLYRAASDIATRAGIADGLILAPKHQRVSGQIPRDRSMMSITQAADALGVSRAAVHKAIQQKRLAARRYGNVFLVDRTDVARYKRNRDASRAR